MGGKTRRHLNVTWTSRRGASLDIGLSALAREKAVYSPRALPSILEQLADLECHAHRARDLELAGHVGEGRVEVAIDELLQIIEAQRERRIALAGIVADRSRH